jgi:hypothetical protein
MIDVDRRIFRHVVNEANYWPEYIIKTVRGLICGAV